jgi:hypothetical protein
MPKKGESKKMKRFAAVAALILLSVAAHAQTADHASCSPWKARWAAVSSGSDLAAIDDVIGKIPGLCPNLKSEGATGRAGAAKRIEQERATRAAAAEKERLSREAAVRAADPCIQARNDWAVVQSASAAVVTAYRDGLPAACATWRGSADGRLAVLAAEKAAADKAAEEARQGDRLEQLNAECARNPKLEYETSSRLYEASKYFGTLDDIALGREPNTAAMRDPNRLLWFYRVHISDVGRMISTDRKCSPPTPKATSTDLLDHDKALRECPQKFSREACMRPLGPDELTAPP